MRWFWLFFFTLSLFSASLATWLWIHHAAWWSVLLNYGAAGYNGTFAGKYYQRYRE